MTRLWPILALLAACGTGPARQAAEPEDPGRVACRQEARDGVSTRDFFRRQNFSDANHTARLRQEMAEAEDRAFNDCLRRRGLTQGGGVERVRRPGEV